MLYTREYIILLASRSMHNTTLECILCAYSTLLASMHNMHIIVLIEQQYTTQQYAQCAYYSRGMHTLELCILQETLASSSTTTLEYAYCTTITSMQQQHSRCTPSMHTLCIVVLASSTMLLASSWRNHTTTSQLVVRW